MDLEEFFKRIDNQYNNALPFVVYSKPHTEELIALLQKDKSLYTISDYAETGFVFAPFDDREASILIPLGQSEKHAATFSKAENSLKNTSSSKVDTRGNQIAHLDLVQKGIDAIKKGDLKKVVLSRKETQKLSEAEPLEIFKRLLSNYPTAFVYCFYHPKVGLWLGATPETLLKIEGHRLFTTALAGTQSYKGTLDVEWGQKEQEEHNMVTNFIVENLQSSVNSLKIEAVKTQKAGSLLHLKTNISGVLDFKNFSLKRLLNSLHPTPAVCGLPKEAAKQFILNEEHYHREFYTGFLGELNVKEKKSRNSNRRNVEQDAYSAITTVSNLFVNLRCMQLKDKDALIYIGGGITKDSNPKAEWEETVNKAQTIKSVL
ncbi:chorismate-binding protein [Flavobacteriaceae bacterium LMO-SS05]